ncbi:MAG: site-specific DNA-methyltransferase [Bacteroidia bacterium]|nr:site-specific DNA-methyltransferase [Bacteroidia bacterium]
MNLDHIHISDALIGLKKLPSGSIDCVVTSPPYWGLRNYGVEGQIGLEKSFEQYIEKLLKIFDEVYRVLKNEGTAWINIGDTYWGSLQGFRVRKSSETGFQKAPVEAGYYAASKGKPPMAHRHRYMKAKSLVLIPERFALGMVERGWILRNTIIWNKPNAMPESVKDRFTNDFEYLFFFTKSKSYYFDQQFEDFSSNEYDIRRMKDGRREYNSKYRQHDKRNELKIRARSAPYIDENAKGRNKRTVWTISTQPFKEAHFAVFPEQLIETPIMAGCPEKGIVLDPFIGSGTTAIVAKRLNRKYIGFELNPEYVKIANQRIENSKSTNQNTKTISINKNQLNRLAKTVMSGLGKL